MSFKPELELFPKRTETITETHPKPRDVSSANAILSLTTDIEARLDVDIPFKRPKGLAGNVLGFIAGGYSDKRARDMEVFRGAEGYSPAAIQAIFPNDELCLDRLEGAFANHEAWNDLTEDPNSEW